MMRTDEFLSGLQVLDESDAVKLSEEYPTVTNQKKNQLYKEVMQRMREKQISVDSEMIERFEVSEAPKKSSFRSISAAAACLLFVAGITGGGVWMLQRMEKDPLVRPGQETVISESEPESESIDDTAAPESSEELPQEVIIPESEPESGSVDDTAAPEPLEAMPQHDRTLDFTVTFNFGDRIKEVDSKMIADWVMRNADGTAKLNGDGDFLFDLSQIGAFVEEMAAETDTWGTDRMFHATIDGWITVPWTGELYSIYGWKIDQTKTIEQLVQLLHEGETVTVEPVYLYTGYTRDTDDIGTTYIEADISEQHAWVYQNGEIVFECDFVSGTENDPERQTHRGICPIRAKEKDRTLGAYTADGYEISVKYWMPFNYCGCGFHDADRDDFGTDHYLTDGSHGCLEVSGSDAQQLYALAEVGMPCIIHD